MSQIPTIELKHNDQAVFFAYRTMEEVHKKLGGKPDVPHRHDYYTVILAKKACGRHIIDYVDYPLLSNMVFFVAPGQVHQVIIQGEPSGDILMFNDEFLAQNLIQSSFIHNLGLFSDLATTPPLQIAHDVFQHLLFLSAKIGEAFALEPSFKFDTIASYLKLLLIECNKFAVQPLQTDEQSLQSGRNIVGRFKQLLEDHFSRWHKVADYANEMHISSDYLNNVIKTTVGKTAKEFILHRLILESKRLGLHTELSNKEIAYQLGFDDPSHFSKFFKREEGSSFSDFRKLIAVSS